MSSMSKLRSADQVGKGALAPTRSRTASLPALSSPSESWMGCKRDNMVVQSTPKPTGLSDLTGPYQGTYGIVELGFFNLCWNHQGKQGVLGSEIC